MVSKTMKTCRGRLLTDIVEKLGMEGSENLSGARYDRQVPLKAIVRRLLMPHVG
jgi:hypothetical protein